MTFGTPLAAALLLALLPLTILHWLLLRRRRLAVPNLPFWRTLNLPPPRPRRTFDRTWGWLVALVALGTLAAARPQHAGSAAGEIRILVDRSASLQADGRWEAVRREVDTVLDAAAGHEVTLFTAPGSPVPVRGGDRIRRRLEETGPLSESGSLPETVAGLLDARPDLPLVVVTDRPGRIPEGLRSRCVVRPVGEVQSNVALLGGGVRAVPGGWAGQVRLFLAGDEPAEVRLIPSSGDPRTLRMTPGERVVRWFGAGTLHRWEVRIESPADAAAWDDVWSWSDGAEPIRLLGEIPDPVRRALRAADLPVTEEGGARFLIGPGTEVPSDLLAGGRQVIWLGGTHGPSRFRAAGGVADPRLSAAPGLPARESTDWAALRIPEVATVADDGDVEGWLYVDGADGRPAIARTTDGAREEVFVGVPADSAWGNTVGFPIFWKLLLSPPAAGAMRTADACDLAAAAGGTADPLPFAPVGGGLPVAPVLACVAVAAALALTRGWRDRASPAPAAEGGPARATASAGTG